MSGIIRFFVREGDEHNCEWRLRAEALEHELRVLLRGAALEDSETGLSNNVQLSRDLSTHLARLRRRGRTFSVALFDVRDGTAPERDLSWEQAGIAADTLSGTARREDTVYRVSRHQYAVLLADTDGTGAERFRERVLESFAAGGARSARLQFHVRCGVAEAPPDLVQTADLLVAAGDDLAARPAA